MKILFYAEIVPIRNSYHQHSTVATEFLNIIESNFEYIKKQNISVKIVTNKHVRVEIQKKFPHLRPFLHTLSNESEEELGKYLVDWQHDGTLVWKELMLGKGGVSKYIKKVLGYIRKEYEYDTVICWGQNGALSAYCKQNKLNLFHMELSSVRKPYSASVIIDPRGVNGLASTSELHIEDIKDIVDSPMSPNYARMLLSLDEQNITDSKTAYDAPKSLCNDIVKVNSDSKLALVPLQLFDDANILLYSPYKTPLDFLKDVIPKLVESGYEVIVKPHPAAIHRPINYLHQLECLNYCGLYEMVTVVNSECSPIENLSLINAVDLVVTINSSLGFESTLQNKVVCVIGDAMYKPKGVFPTIEQVIGNEFCVKTYNKNIKYLISFMLQHYFIKKEYLKKEKVFEILSSMSGVKILSKEFFLNMKSERVSD